MPKSQDSKTTTGDILIVDDETANLKLLEELLSREGYQVRPADLPQLAIDSALAQPPALILLDVRMPEIDGFEVCRRLKQDERTRDVPVIFVSALQDVQDRVQGFDAGGVDFITKPFQEEEVLARVQTHLTLRNMQLHLENLVAERTAELTATNKALEAETKEVTRQRDLNSSILSSLDSHLAVLNWDGEIIAINDAWRAFATANDVDSTENIGVGANYLDVCRFAEIDDSKRVIAGIGSVMDGTLARFDTEYDCHSPSEKRWFSMTVTPMKTKLGGAVVMHTSITKRKQAERELQQYQQRLKALASKLTIAEETERRRIAADLHDHVGQTLALIRLQIASVRELISDPGQTEMLDEISESLRQTVQETRDLIYDLSPPQLNEIGLSAAILEWLEEHVEKRYEIKTECISNGPEQRLDKNLRSILFRNTRELVINVIKHSHATQVKIRVLQDHNHVEILVKDNGIGFDAGAVSPFLKGESGFGLFSIKERMADMGGSLEIVSEPGQGTKAIMHVPLENGEG